MSNIDMRKERAAFEQWNREYWHQEAPPVNAQKSDPLWDCWQACALSRQPSAPASAEDERAAFEAACIARSGVRLEDCDIDFDFDAKTNRYLSDFEQSAWEGWQDRAALAAAHPEEKQTSHLGAEQGQDVKLASQNTELVRDAAKAYDLLFDGNAVLTALDETAKTRTGPQQVADVLDAVIRAARAQRAAAQGNGDE